VVKCERARQKEIAGGPAPPAILKFKKSQALDPSLEF
jgi:hypothetical protein